MGAPGRSFLTRAPRRPISPRNSAPAVVRRSVLRWSRDRRSESVFRWTKGRRRVDHQLIPHTGIDREIVAAKVILREDRRGAVVDPVGVYRLTPALSAGNRA